LKESGWQDSNRNRRKAPGIGLGIATGSGAKRASSVMADIEKDALGQGDQRNPRQTKWPDVEGVIADVSLKDQAAGRADATIERLGRSTSSQ